MARTLESYLPPVQEDGIVTSKDTTLSGALTVSGATTFTGATTGLRHNTESISAATKTVTSAMSGRMFVDVLGSGTTTFTLPDAVAGLTYTFVCGNASGEILINPQSGDAIVGKTHGAENGTGIAPAAGTGIKNTAATNVVGDFCTLVALDGTTWYMVAVAGVWASQ